MTGNNDSNLSHPDKHLPRMKKDEADVQSLVQIMETCWISPFDPDHENLVSLSTGIAAPPDVAKDVLAAHTIGKDAYEEFKQKRMESDSPETKFNDRITRKQQKRSYPQG